MTGSGVFYPIGNAMVLTPEGKLVIAGEFTMVNGQPRANLVQVDPTGVVDSSFSLEGSGFAQNASGQGITALGIQPDGKILVAGDFNALNGVQVNRLVRLHPDGTRDTDFTAGSVGQIQTIAVQSDGKILLGGYFTSYGGQPASRVVRINADGTYDETFQQTGTGIGGYSDARVYTIVVQPDDKILVGGVFTTYNSTNRRYLLRLQPDGTLDSSFFSGLTGPNGGVRKVALLPDGQVMVVGEFGRVNGIDTGSVARLNTDGTVDTDFKNAITQSMSDVVAQDDGRVIVTGGNLRPTRLNSDGSQDSRYALAGIDITGAGAYDLLLDASGKLYFAYARTLYDDEQGLYGEGGVVRILPVGTPLAPQDVVAVRGDKTASVSWKPPADDGGLPVSEYAATAVPGGATCATDGDGRECEITGLANGTTYTVHVTATNAVGTSNDVAASVTPATTPGAPSGVTAARGDKKVSVSWQAPADNGGLTISKYVTTATPGGATCETTSGLSCDITGLTNGTGYTVTVVAFNDAGGSPASDPSPPVTPGSVPSVPRDVAAVRGDKKAVVSWHAPADNGGFAVTGYTATAQPGGATCTTDGDGRDCEITVLTNGSTYTVHVTATNAVGTSNDVAASVTPATTPSAPHAVTATPGFRTASVSWQTPANNGGDPILGYTMTANPGGRTCTASGGQCVVTGLSDFKTYTFTVTARNSVGEGSVSEPSAAITLSGDEVVARVTAGSQVSTGAPLALDAAASTSLSGQIATYEWDFGDGTFAEGGATVSHIWAQRGVKTVRVRVTSDGGMTDIATTNVEVFAGSRREPGVSIDQGAPYTKSRDVTLTLGWPDKARQARISNDGGFADAQTIDVNDAISWVLDDSVEVVATQVVYVRFLGPGVDESRTFSDNIIFDNTAPVLNKVTAVPKTGDTQKTSIQEIRDVRALAARKRVWRISVKASDDRSGMGRLQVNASRRSKGTVSVRYRQKARVKLTGGSRKVFVRVSDNAGNWTKWKKAKVIVPRR